MSPAVRPVVRMAFLPVAFGLALVAYQTATAKRGRPNDLVARVWTLGSGDSEASVMRKLGKPVRSTPIGTHERLLRFEEGDEGAQVAVGPQGVVTTSAIPSLSDLRSEYRIVGGVPSNPSN